MANSLDDVLDGNDSTEQHVEGVQQVEENQTQQQESALQTDEGNENDAQTAPTAESQDANGKHVPLAALEAERAGRKDWKEKALRFEGELKAMREMQAQREQQAQQPQAQQYAQQQQEMNPMAYVEQTMFNERCNTSEMFCRQKYADLDEKVEAFMAAKQENPALEFELRKQSNPYEYAYKEGARLLLQKEMGDDPTAYLAKKEEEWKAKFLAEQPAQTATSQSAAKPNLPTSLAGARSSAGRNAANWTGPTPLDQIFN